MNVPPPTIQSLMDFQKGTSSHRRDIPLQTELVETVCGTVIRSPPEPGSDLDFAESLKPLHSVVKEAESTSMAEASVCAHWLDILLEAPREGAAEELAALAGGPLWGPVKRLAFGALAWLGERKRLGDVLPREAPFSLWEADARMEAVRGEIPGPGWTDGISREENDWMSAEHAGRWTEILHAETLLAAGNPSAFSPDGLFRTASRSRSVPPETLEDGLDLYLAGRAAFVLSRWTILHRGDLSNILKLPGARGLSRWKRNYIEGLGAWRQGNPEGAAAHLESAFRENPQQTPVRLALATLLSNRSPAAALDLVDVREPTFETAVARSALLARQGRCDEAVSALPGECGPAGWEPPAFTFRAACEGWRRRATALKAAFLESSGKGKEAEIARGRHPSTGSVCKTRRLLAARRERDTLDTGQGWRRSILDQTVKRLRHEAASIPLNGDALFYRAVSLADEDPSTAAADFRRLLRQSSWVGKEREAGGGRLAFMGDFLLKSGHPEDAVAACEAAASASFPGMEGFARHSVDPLHLAREWLSVLEGRGKEDEKEAFCRELLRSEHPGALAAGVFFLLRRALETAASGQWDRAEERLKELQSVLEQDS